MAKNDKFKWDPKVLEREEIEIPIGEEKVKFYEYSRDQFLEFVNEFFEAQPKEEDDKQEEEKDKEPAKRRTFEEIAREQLPLVYNWLSKATRGERTPEFFEQLDLGFYQLGHLLDLLTKLNHCFEVLGSGGNLLALPTIITLEAETRDK